MRDVDELGEYQLIYVRILLPDKGRFEARFQPVDATHTMVLENYLIRAAGFFYRASSNSPTPLFERTYPEIPMVLSRDQMPPS